MSFQPTSLAEGLLGLYGGIKGFLDADKAMKKQQRLLDNARASEQAWYQRNYYGNYVDNVASRAIIKRVEDSMRRRDEQARAMAAVNGGTHEQMLAAQEQNRQMMDQTVGELASRSDSYKNSIDAQHQQNRQNFYSQQAALYNRRAEQGSAMLGSGIGLINNAIKAVEWGRETPAKGAGAVPQGGKAKSSVGFSPDELLAYSHGGLF